MLRLLIATFCLIGVTSCTNPRPTIWVERKVYHVLPPSAELRGKTFFITFSEQAQKESLEMKIHGNFLANNLRGLGMIATKNADKADYVFTLKFEVSSQQKLSISGGSQKVTQGGVTSFRTQTNYGPGSSTTYGKVRSIPTVVQSTGPSASTDTEFTRVATMVIHSRTGMDSGSIVPEYEGTVYSEGMTRNTPQIFPALLGALLHKFPTPSGEHEYIEVHLDDSTVKEITHVNFIR